MCLSFHMGCPCTPVSVSFVKLILFLCVHRSRGFVLVGFAIFWFVLVISFSSYLCLFIFFQFWAFSHVCPRVLSGTSLRSYCSVVNWSVYARFGNNLFSILLNIGWYGKSCKNIGIQRKGKKEKETDVRSSYQHVSLHLLPALFSDCDGRISTPRFVCFLLVERLALLFA